MRLRRQIISNAGGLVRQIPTVRTVLTQALIGAFSPANLFRAGEKGAWYDPSDLNTMFTTDSGQLTPAYVGGPVGLLLDKRYNLARGPEIVRDPAIDDPTMWRYVASGTGITVAFSGGAVHMTSDGTYNDVVVKAPGVDTALNCIPHAVYEYEIVVDDVTGGGIAVMAGNQQSNTITTKGTYKGIIKATATLGGFGFKRFSTTSAMTASVSYMSFKQIAGNHLIGTGTGRPTLRSDHKYGPNLATNGDFTNGLAGWGTFGNGTVAVNANNQAVVTNTTSPTTTGLEIQLPLTAGKMYELEFDLSTSNNATALYSIRLGRSPTIVTDPGYTQDIVRGDSPRNGGTRWVYRFTASLSNPYMKFYTPTWSATLSFTLDNVVVREVLSLGPELVPVAYDAPLAHTKYGSFTQTVGSRSVTFNSTSAGSENLALTPNVPVKSGGTYEVTYTVESITNPSGGGTNEVRILVYGTNNFGTGIFRASAGTYTEVIGPLTTGGSIQQAVSVQNKLAGGGAVVRDISAREVLPLRTHYLEFDGGDDCLLSPVAFDMGSATKLSVMTGFRKPISNAASTMLLELGPDVVSTANTFAVMAPGNSGTYPIRYLTAGSNAGGFIASDFTTSALSGSSMVILSGQSDKMAITSSGRVNGGQHTGSTFFNGVVNTGPFVNTQALYMGRRANSSLGMKGSVYGMVIRAAETSPGDIAATERLLATKMGVTL